MNKLTILLKELVKQLFYKFGYRISRSDSLDDFEAFLYLLLSKRNEIFFVEIGANDGKSFDPIYKFILKNQHKVKGIVIEPMKDTFGKLEKTYRKFPNITPINVAIHNSEKFMQLYKVDPTKAKDLPDWSKGIASFNKNHHKLSKIPIPTDVIITEKVHCISFDELIQKYQISKIDLLIIDTEGYDSEIIFNIDFNKIKPSIIRFEHGLSRGLMSKDTFLNVIDFLHKNGYEIIIEYSDATAYQRELIVDL